MTDLIFTKDTGEIVSRAYVRERASQHLSSWRRLYTLEQRQSALASTIDDDAWLSGRNHQTVGSICRDVAKQLMTAR